MYARVTNIRFPPEMRAEVVRVVGGLRPVLREQRGFNGLQVLRPTLLAPSGFAVHRINTVVL